MARLRNKTTGVIVNVSEETAEHLGDAWAPADQPEPTGYADLKVTDLKAEIARRNEGRDEDARIPDDGKKAELVAALEADDEAAFDGEDDATGDGDGAGTSDDE